jgi:prophage antirepressor-like protein
MSLVVESTTNGINESQCRLKVRIFSLRGAHLNAMFARTSVAKEFRRWVLDVLDHEVGNTQPAPSPASNDSRTLCYKRANIVVNEYHCGMMTSFSPPVHG